MSRSGVYADLVDTKKEIRDFLTSRRARITPEQAGLVSFGSRRVPGLRREEVAVLAGVSVPYYTRLERGDMSGVSQSVLEALARALELDDAERAHLFDLARAAQPMPARPRRRQAKQRVRPEIQWTLDAITGAAAFVSNERLDILAANELGRALFSELYAARRGRLTPRSLGQPERQRGVGTPRRSHLVAPSGHLASGYREARWHRESESECCASRVAPWPVLRTLRTQAAKAPEARA